MRMKGLKVISVINGVTGYLAAAGLTVIFALYCSGRVGWFLLLVFALAPMLSLLLCLYEAGKLQTDMAISEELLEKGGCCRVLITLKNQGPLPSPLVRIALRDCPGLRCADRECYVSLMPFSTKTVAVEYTAKLCGLARIGVEAVSASDYLGLFGLRLRHSQAVPECWGVGVLPQIAPVSAGEEYLRRVMHSAVNGKESEETLEDADRWASGFPGYEHREYQPGDPLKRINWKLSAKREQLLVRLDEAKAGASVAVVMDTILRGELLEKVHPAPELYRETDREELRAALVQNVLETSLGIAQLLLSRGFAVFYYVYESGGWTRYAVTAESSLAQLCDVLAGYAFKEEDGKTPRLPVEELTGESGRGAAVVFCTPIPDAHLEAELVLAKNAGLAELVLYTASEGEGRGL